MPTSSKAPCANANRNYPPVNSHNLNSNSPRGEDETHPLKANYDYSYSCTIEFQKRGLSHCHTLLWVDNKNKIQDAPQIDEHISVEIPDPVQDPRGYKVVTDLMMHGPCGVANLGPDRILTKIGRSKTSISTPVNNTQIDEIQNYVDGRFISPYEA
ncbi:hypothetical protein Tco_0098641 [Tanacetum coccineum]